MSDWDDDNFEVDVSQIEQKKVVVIDELPDEKPLEVAPKPAAPKVKTKSKIAQKTFSDVIDRELTDSEKIEMQRNSDLSFAMELFGTKEESDLSELNSVADFRGFGDTIGEKLATRANNMHYVDLLSALLKRSTLTMEASKLRILSKQLKDLADERSTKEKEEKKPKGGKGAPAKPTLKGTQKANKIDVDDYGDYGYSDDFGLEEDFM